jgi:pimeloyl-ACP methyl ester carboxylesterase
MASLVTHQTAKTQYVDSPNGSTKYAYRRFGNTNTTAPPVLFLVHFRGTMDFWDPLLINTIAATRPVILLDQSGVGKSTGSVQSTIRAMGQDVLHFLSVFPDKPTELDVFGFSMGGYVAQMVALDAPAKLGASGPKIRRLVLAGTGTSAGEGIEPNTQERAVQVTKHATVPEPNYDNCFYWIFFHPNSETSQAAGKAWWKRIHERDESTSGEPRSNAVSWQYADQGAGLKAMAGAQQVFLDPTQAADAAFERFGELKDTPVLIAQGVDDYMIPTSQSVVMQQQLPDARLYLYPDSGHAFLYQFAEEFGKTVVSFLDAGLKASL